MNRLRGRNIVYLVIFILSLSISMVILQLALGIFNVITWVGGGGGGKIVIGVGARTIFSSRVHEKLYNNMLLDRDLSNVYPVVTALVILNGDTVVLKGYRYDDMVELYRESIISGEILDGPAVLVGVGLAEKYNLSVGSNIYVSSLNTVSSMILRVTGIYNLGGPGDYEIVSNMGIARMLSGIPDKYVSYISYDGIDISEKTGRSYVFRLNFNKNVSGVIAFYDVDGELVLEEDLSNGRLEALLPYGSYTLYFVWDGLRMEIMEIFVDSDIDLTPSYTGRVSLVVMAGSTYNITLSNSSIQSIPYKIIDGKYIYTLTPGIYRLSVGSKVYDIIVLRDSIIDLGRGIPKPKYRVTITVYDELGNPLDEYYVTFRDMDGRIVYTSRSTSYNSTFLLGRGIYDVTISNGLVFTSERIQVDGDLDLEFRLPIYNRRISERAMRAIYNVRSLEGIDIVNLALETYVGLTFSLFIVFPISLLALISLGLISVNRFFFVVNEELIKTLFYLNYTPLNIIWRLLSYSYPLLFSAFLASIPIYLYLDDIFKGLIRLFIYEPHGFELFSYILIVIISMFIWLIEALRTIRNISIE